jgi:hypothetical protein
MPGTVPSAAGFRPARPARSRRTHWPWPGCAVQVPPASTTWPRRTTNRGQPCTVQPSYTEYPARDRMRDPSMVLRSCGSHSARSASEPTAIVPFRG